MISQDEELNKRVANTHLQTKEDATEEQKSKIPAFEAKFQLALKNWQTQFPNRPPPVYWDETKKDFFWVNRKARRKK